LWRRAEDAGVKPAATKTKQQTARRLQKTKESKKQKSETGALKMPG
jgi:hypothetical protein